MKYDLDDNTKAVLTAVIAGDDVKFEVCSQTGLWFSTGSNPLLSASAGMKLRLKPGTIRIGEYDVPEPMRVAPVIDIHIWRVNIWYPENPYFCEHGSAIEQINGWITTSLCHTTKEAAITHAKALRSLTEVKP